MPKYDSTITGNCGEHYVASYLAGVEMIVAMTRAGLTGIDLMVTEPGAGRPMKIQVKTTRGNRGKLKGREFYSWNTSYAVVNKPDSDLWFAYVDLSGWPLSAESPHLFFVPRDFVAARLSADYKPDSSPTYFALYDDEADAFRGANGLEQMRAAMVANSTLGGATV
jgi:hypothetical protein